MSRKAVIVTGELSGEIHAALLVKALKESSSIELSGMGSTRLREAGVEVVCDYRDISLTGLSEVFFKARSIWRAYGTLKRHLQSSPPDLLILIDFPGFNLRIARVAKRLGIPTVYYIPPQIWAWRKSRIKQIKALVDLVLCILPFEEGLYRDHGVPVKYTGHPFIETVKPLHTKEAFFSLLGIEGEAPVITMMPGSRHQEVERHLPILFRVAARLRELLGRFTLLLPVADTLDEGLFASLRGNAERVFPVKGLAYDCLAHCDAALIASGSATLEAAVLGVPSVVLYKVSALSYLAARMVVKVPHISLPNIIAGHEVFPEFIQSLDPEKIAKTVLFMVKNDTSALRRDLELVRKRLDTSERGSYRIASDRILQFLEQRHGPLRETP